MSEIVAQQTEGLTAGGFLGDATFTAMTEIRSDLWMGGCLAGARLPDHFGFVLSLYPWERYELGPNTDRLQVRLFDGEEIPDQHLLYSLATIVNQQRREHIVFVHCQAGLNRSGLITALALIEEGYTPTEAIGWLRHKRSEHVLCNPVFEKWLLEQ